MKLRYVSNSSSLHLDRQTCVGCGLCIDVCPHGVFEMDGGLARVVDEEACMECGACALNCPVSAIEARSGVGCADAVLTSTFRGGEPRCCCAEDETEDEEQRGCCSEEQEDEDEGRCCCG